MDERWKRWQKKKGMRGGEYEGNERGFKALCQLSNHSGFAVASNRDKKEKDGKKRRRGGLEHCALSYYER